MDFDWLALFSGVSLVFWAVLFFVQRGRISRHTDKKLSEVQAQVEEVLALVTKARYERDVAFMRLATIQLIASSNFETDPHPYRMHPERLLKDMGTIHEAAQIGLREAYRSVAHFSDLSEAGGFVYSLNNDAEPIASLTKLWDGDCYHVVYSVPSFTADKRKDARGRCPCEVEE